MHMHIDLIFSLMMGLLGSNSIASQGAAVVIKWREETKPGVDVGCTTKVNQQK